MTSMTVSLDERTEKELNRLSLTEGIPSSEMAARLLRRAIRAKRPRPTFDVEAIRAHIAEFGDEDMALADSDSAHRASLLADEDAA